MKVGKPPAITPDVRIRELMLTEDLSVRDLHAKLVTEGYSVPNYVTIWRRMKRIEQELMAEGYHRVSGWHKE